MIPGWSTPSARSGGRATDQAHRAAQAHAPTVRVGLQRRAERCDGGQDGLLRLIAQPTVRGADFGRLNHSLLQPTVLTID